MTIYLDFDGVIVDTPKYIMEQIKKQDKNLKYFQKCKKVDWNIILSKCREINNSFNDVKELSKEYDVKIITHVYSQHEGVLKKKYIYNKLPAIDVITVPKYIKKSRFVDSRKAILIDDYDKNVKDWNVSGGYGFLFGNKLKNIFEINDLIKKEGILYDE